jgi:cytochrome c oxidase cbb3-type subunit III
MRRRLGTGRIGTGRIGTAILLTLAVVRAMAQSGTETAPDPNAGRKIFESQCALCHGQTGTGGRGPGLNHPKLHKAPDDDALRKVIANGIDPEMPGAWQLTPREVASVAVYVRSLGSVPPEALAGDAARGAAVYQARGCAHCHMIGGAGEGLGPELSEIGARRNGAYLRQTLIKPTASLPEGFLYVAAVTASGQTVRGIRVNEDSFTIQLKDAQGQFHSFRKAELKELRRLRQESPMPSFEGSLSAAELDDIVAYLASLRGKS